MTIVRAITIPLLVFISSILVAVEADSAQPTSLLQCLPSSTGAVLSSLPPSVVARTPLNPAARVAVSELKLCLVRGEQIYIKPTVVVHYFVRQKNGTIRSRAVMLSVPRSFSDEGSDLALIFSNGVVKRFPRTSVVSSQSADDYEIYVVGQGATIPSGLAASPPDYVVK